MSSMHFGHFCLTLLKVASDSEMSWEVMPEMPAAQQNHGCVVASNAQSSGIFVTGGRNDPSGSYSNQAFFFDLNSEIWTELQELPESRVWHSMGLIGQGVGGMLYPVSPTGYR